MGAYTKPWLPLDDQVDKLEASGVDVEPRDRTLRLLAAVGYYRLSGYLYPFRDSLRVVDEAGRTRTAVLDTYRPGTSIGHAVRVIDFDRRLRGLVMDGVDRIEVAVRMRVGYVLGRRSPLAHLDPATFHPAFVVPRLEPSGGWPTVPSRHADWLHVVARRRDASDEAFVAHFRERYDGQMPVWALTELLELGHLSRLYRGLDDRYADEIAAAFGVPTKRLMASWLASVNYVRNVAAHHARLFNRRLQHAPSRPRPGLVPLLDHLRLSSNPKTSNGAYAALAVMAYLLRSVDGSADWTARAAALLDEFPAVDGLPLTVTGAPPGRERLDLWRAEVGP